MIYNTFAHKFNKVIHQRNKREPLNKHLPSQEPVSEYTGGYFFLYTSEIGKYIWNSTNIQRKWWKPAKLWISSVRTKNKRKDWLVISRRIAMFWTSLYWFLSFLMSTLKVPNSMHDQCHQRGRRQPFFCGSSSCNKQDTLLGQCSQEAGSCLLVPEEFIWGAVARVLSTLCGQDVQVILRNRGNAHCLWNSELGFKQYLWPNLWCKSSGALTWCGEQRGDTLSGIFFFTDRGGKLILLSKPSHLQKGKRKNSKSCGTFFRASSLQTWRNYLL